MQTTDGAGCSHPLPCARGSRGTVCNRRRAHHRRRPKARPSPIVARAGPRETWEWQTDQRRAHQTSAQLPRTCPPRSVGGSALNDQCRVQPPLHALPRIHRILPRRNRSKRSAPAPKHDGSSMQRPWSNPGPPTRTPPAERPLRDVKRQRHRASRGASPQDPPRPRPGLQGAGTTSTCAPLRPCARSTSEDGQEATFSRPRRCRQDRAHSQMQDIA